MGDELSLKLPSDAKLQQIRAVLVDDEDWRFGRIKMDGKKPRFEVPAPSTNAPDNVEVIQGFCGVVLVARKNFYQSDEDKEAGNDPKEKRALYVVRLGKYMPELLYVSPTAIRNWKYFARDVVQQSKNYYEVLCEFGAEQIKGKNYTWSKPTFKIARTLTDIEAAYIQTLRELVLGRVQEYEDNTELDKYEDTALAVDKAATPSSVADEDLHKQQSAAVEEDEEEDTPPAPVQKEKEKKKSKPAPPPEEEEEEEDTPKSKARAGYPDLDED